MIRRIILTGAIAVMALGTAIGGPGTAAAQDVSPLDYAGCQISIVPVRVLPGERVTVEGSGLQPNFTTDVLLYSTPRVLGQITTDAAGAFRATFTIPRDIRPGAHRISVACDGTGMNISNAGLQVGAPNRGGPSSGGGISAEDLPRTGSDIAPLVAMGLAALIAGLIFIMVARRRRRAEVLH